MNNERGQIILVLVLVITVALAIGISVVQRSLSDISTSTKVEESSRAFSAAEAGIEKGLKELNNSSLTVSLENNSSATVTDEGLLPLTPPAGTRQAPLEEDPLEKEEVAQEWLADHRSTNNPPDLFYTQSTLDVYWGNPAATDKAALQLTLVYYDGTKYVSRKWYLDDPSASRDFANNFDTNSDCAGFTLTAYSYQCKYTIGGTNSGVPDPGGPLPSTLPSKLMLLRARLLYNTSKQAFAVQAVGNCGKDCSLPPQQRRLVSIGISGQTQRKVSLTQKRNVVPSYFDYALFSIGEISK